MDKTQSQTELSAPATVPETQKDGQSQEVAANGVASAPAPTAAAADGENKQADTTDGKPAEPEQQKPAANDADRIEEVNAGSGEQGKKAEDGTAAAPAEQEEEDTRPAYLSKNPALSKFFESLPSILEKTGHGEMWGVQLKDAEDVPTVNVMIKFLRANEGNVKEAEEQLTKALEWRKTMDPLAIVEKESFDSGKFKGLGYVTKHSDGKDGQVVFTWNIYGSAKKIDETFGNIDEFIKWRVALMELAIRELKLSEATTVMDYNGEDPFQMLQVHDYQNVSFLRMNPTIRNASRRTIEVFSMAYPELLKEKYFVNVPLVMGWVFTALKVFLSKNTVRKFHPITNGANLVREFSSFGSELPKAYGGKGGELVEVGTTVSLHDPIPEPSQEEAPAADKDAGEKKADKTKPEENAPASSEESSKPAEKADNAAEATTAAK